MPTVRHDGVMVAGNIFPYPHEPGRIVTASDEIAFGRCIQLLAEAFSHIRQDPDGMGGLTAIQQLNHLLEQFNEEHSPQALAAEQVAAVA